MQESPYLDGNGFLLEKLQRIPFLGSISEKHIKDILRLSKIRTFDDRETITKEKTYDNWIYILFSGAVRIIKNGKQIGLLNEVGDIFGELAVIDGKTRSASVEAIGSTVCMAIDASFMNEAAEPIEQARFVSILYKLFAEVIAQRMRAADDELTKLRAEIETLKKKNSEAK